MNGRELVRGRRLRGVSGQAAADDLSLVARGASRARRCRHADEQFRRRRTAPGAPPRGLGPYGTVDMAGNVKEWVWNDNRHAAPATSSAAHGTIRTTVPLLRFAGSRSIDRRPTAFAA